MAAHATTTPISVAALIETAPGVSVEHVKAATEADLAVGGKVAEMAL